MKQVTVHIPDEKVPFVIDLLRNLQFVTSIETVDEAGVRTEHVRGEDEALPAPRSKAYHEFLNRL